MESKAITAAVENGRAKQVSALVQEAIDAGVDVKEILDSLLEGMVTVGVRFKNNEIFVPEVLISARALNFGLELIKPILSDTGVQPVGKALIGTVKGDLHDIGKNLVKMMFVGTGFEVIDLGVDVEAEVFVEKAEEHAVDVICMSALLTTTMSNMQSVIDMLVARGVRDKYIVMIGGAPVTAKFAEEIGADYYSANASTAAQMAKAALEK